MESALARLGEAVQAQAQDLVGIATGYARTDDSIFIHPDGTAIMEGPNLESPSDCGVPAAMPCVYRHGVCAAHQDYYDFLEKFHATDEGNTSQPAAPSAAHNTP